MKERRGRGRGEGGGERREGGGGGERIKVYIREDYYHTDIKNFTRQFKPLIGSLEGIN